MIPCALIVSRVVNRIEMRDGARVRSYLLPAELVPGAELDVIELHAVGIGWTISTPRHSYVVTAVTAMAGKPLLVACQCVEAEVVEIGEQPEARRKS